MHRGAENVVDIIKELKELAINAATDTNTDEDRAILQKKFDQALENINDIATTSNFNGKYLLDGTLAAVFHGTRTETQIKTVLSTVETTTTIESVTTVETTTTIASGSNSITEDGVYELASDFTGTLNISAQNVKIVGGGNLSTVQINVTASNAKLWIENLNISNGNWSAIQFGGGTNTLIVKGTNTLSSSGDSAAVNIGSGLNILGDGSITASGSAGVGIGTNKNQSSGANINIGDSVNISARSSDGAGIGSGYRGRVGNITIGGNANVNAYSWDGAGIGSGNNGNCGNITIGDSANVEARSGRFGAGIGSGSGGSCRYIRIGDSANVKASSGGYGGDDIGCGMWGSSARPNLNVKNLVTGISALTEPSAPTATTITTTETVEVETTTTVEETVTETVEVPTTFLKNVVFQSGDQAGQVLSVKVGDMHTKSLRANVPSEADKERLIDLQNDADKYKAFQALLEKVQTMTLDDINFRTREDANIAIRVVDSALEYATDQATNIGAYLQRLDSTLENVINAQENTQAAESVIRDADMAREMTNYARANILSQSAQSMLAQINQNSGNVISLLK